MTDKTIHAIAECVQKMLSVSAWRLLFLGALIFGAEIAYAVHGMDVPATIRAIMGH